jgi:hypothetical protein
MPRRHNAGIEKNESKKTALGILKTKRRSHVNPSPTRLERPREEQGSRPYPWCCSGAARGATAHPLHTHCTHNPHPTPHQPPHPPIHPPCTHTGPHGPSPRPPPGGGGWTYLNISVPMRACVHAHSHTHPLPTSQPSQVRKCAATQCGTATSTEVRRDCGQAFARTALTNCERPMHNARPGAPRAATSRPQP